MAWPTMFTDPCEVYTSPPSQINTHLAVYDLLLLLPAEMSTSSITAVPGQSDSLQAVEPQFRTSVQNCSGLQATVMLRTGTFAVSFCFRGLYHARRCLRHSLPRFRCSRQQGRCSPNSSHVCNRLIHAILRKIHRGVSVLLGEADVNSTTGSCLLSRFCAFQCISPTQRADP